MAISKQAPRIKNRDFENNNCDRERDSDSETPRFGGAGAGVVSE